MKQLLFDVPNEKAQEFAKEMMKLAKKHDVKIEGLDSLLPVTERIKTVEDALSELGTPDEEIADFFKKFEPMGKDVVAYMKLRVIAEALNEGWVPKFTDDEYRWYPWFTLWTEEELKEKSEQWKKDHALWLFGGPSSRGASCGLAYAGSYAAWSSSRSNRSARLAVKSEELAVYFGKQFISIWADYVGPFNRKDE